jgi:uncharacterized membrane protein YfcA
MEQKKYIKKPMDVAILIAVGLLAGMVSGLIGVGGGIVIVPALVLLMGFTQHEAQGTSLAMMIPPIGILAVLEYHRNGHIRWEVVAWLCVGFIVGALLGSKLAIWMPKEILKKVYGGLLVLIAARLIFFK